MWDLDKAKKLIDESRVVSFDVFDTLLTRSVSDPKDIFKLVESNYKASGFAKQRVLAEKKCTQEQ